MTDLALLSGEECSLIAQGGADFGAFEFKATVPGMPVGSPGMDGPVYQGRTQPYDVMLLDRSGGAGVFARYR